MLHSSVNSAGRIKSKNTFFLYLFSALTKQHWNPLRYLHSIISISHCFFFSPFSFKSNIFFSIVYSRSHLTRLFAPFYSEQKCVWIEFSITFFCSTYKQNKGPPSLLNLIEQSVLRIFLFLIDLKTESTAASFSNNMCKDEFKTF